MTKAIVLTSADSAAHNLYGLILAVLGVTQLPQRVDQGAVFFPDFVASVNFYISSGTLSVQDQNGNQMTVVPATTNISIGNGQINDVSLQAMKIQASGSGITINVTVFQV